MKRSYVYIIAFLTILVGICFYNYDDLDISYSKEVYEDLCASPKSFPVYFQTNGGSSIPPTNNVTVAFSYNNGTMPTPTRSGYNFKGWYVNSSLTTIYNGNNLATVEYIENGCTYIKATLYAKWEAVNADFCPNTGVFNLYYQSNGGSAISMERRQGLIDIVSFSFPTPTRSGYNFKGWYKDSGLTTPASPNGRGINFSTQTIGGCPVQVGTVYAKWEKISTPTTPTTPPATPPATPPSTPPKPPAQEEPVKTCPNVINTLHISFNTDGGTEIDDLDICLTCDEEEVTLPQPEKDGKNFLGWYSDDTLENQVIVDGLNTEIQITQFNVTIDKNEDGCDKDVANTTIYARYEDATCETPDLAYLSINFISGDEVEEIENVKKCLACDEDYYDLPILKKDDYLFGGWYIDGDYSRLVSKKINLSNAVKYLNVTRDFENGCSTDTLSTILYAKWIPLSEVRNVRVVFVSQGSIIDEKLYNVDSVMIETPKIKEKGIKLLGWYQDSSYEKELTTVNDLLENSYGIEVKNGQVFLYAYAKTEEVKTLISRRTIMLLIGIIVVGGISYIVVSSVKDNSKKKGNKKNKKEDDNVGNRVTWHT